MGFRDPKTSGERIKVPGRLVSLRAGLEAGERGIGRERKSMSST